MLNPGTLLKASFDASTEFFHPHSKIPASHAPQAHRVSPVMVPIRSLGASHGQRIAAHLLALGPQDRYLRFGYAASDVQIQRYVDGLNFERDEIFGIYNRQLQLIGMAHLAFSTDPELKSCAEFGVSVQAHARGRGYGARLFERATLHARNEGVDMMFIHALSENTPMLNLARKAGAIIERDGAESEAYLTLAPADLDSRMSELFQEKLAQTNYRLKRQARKFRHLLDRLQDMRRGTPGGCDQAPR